MKYIFFVLLFFICSIALSQITSFQRTFPDDNETFLGSIIETADHNFLVSGHTTSFDLGQVEAYIMLTNVNGIATWSYNYGDNHVQHILNLYEDEENNFFFTGYTLSETDSKNAIFGKIDGIGNLLWVNTYGGEGDETARKILRDNSGDFYIFGSSTSGFADDLEDVYVVKISSNGTLIWAKAYGSEGNENARSAAFDNNGNILIVGSTDGFSSNKDGFVLKIDTDGNIVWSNSYASTKSDLIQNLIVDENNNIILTGFTKKNLNLESSFYNPFLMKLTNDGNHDWLKIYEDSVQTKGFSLTEGHNGGYLIGTDGYDIVAMSDTMNCTFIRTNDFGEILWSKRIGGEGDEWRPRLISTSDGGYLVGTSSTSFRTDTMNNIYLVKMDDTGESGCNTTDFPFDEIDTAFVQTPIAFNTGIGGSETSLSWTSNPVNFIEDTLCSNIITDYETVCKIGNTNWNYIANGACDGIVTDSLTILKDTIYNEQKYFELYNYGYIENTNAGFLREDTINGKLWYSSGLESGMEYLVMDLSLEKDDSFTVYTVNASYDIIVDTVYYDSDNRKHVGFDDDMIQICSFTPKFEFIEGVGATACHFYQGTGYVSQLFSVVLCCHKDNELIFSNETFSNQCYILDVDIPEINIEQDLIVYPNPSDGNFAIQFQNEGNKIYQLDVYTLSGKVVLSTNTSSKVININSESIKDGMYFIKLTCEDKTLSGKILIESK